MRLLRNLWEVIIEAIFPLSPAETELFSYAPEEVMRRLPPAPSTPLPNTSSVFAYKDERAAKLVWNLKYKHSHRAATMAGAAMHRALNEIAAANAGRRIILVPMPVADRRRRERGYNQCELLADAISRLDHSGKFPVTKDLLIRKQYNERQTLKSRNERLVGSTGAFAVNEKAALAAVQPLLIVLDDVITTGSTMKEAMDTLRAAGFRNVIGLSLAH